jgi:hypothetical protein
MTPINDIYQESRDEKRTNWHFQSMGIVRKVVAWIVTNFRILLL